MYQICSYDIKLTLAFQLVGVRLPTSSAVGLAMKATQPGQLTQVETFLTLLVQIWHISVYACVCVHVVYLVKKTMIWDRISEQIWVQIQVVETATNATTGRTQKTHTTASGAVTMGSVWTMQVPPERASLYSPSQCKWKIHLMKLSKIRPGSFSCGSCSTSGTRRYGSSGTVKRFCLKRLCCLFYR